MGNNPHIKQHLPFMKKIFPYWLKHAFSNKVNHHSFPVILIATITLNNTGVYITPLIERNHLQSEIKEYRVQRQPLYNTSKGDYTPLLR